MIRRAWILLALLLVAATPEENRLYRAAQAAFDDKLYDVAQTQLAEILQKFPNSDRQDRTTLLLGQAQLQAGKWEVAIKTLQDGVQRWPDKSPDAYRFWLAEALARGGKFPEAEARYSEVVANHPRSDYRPAALYGLAFVQFKRGKLPEASATLDQLTKLGFRGPAAKSDLPLETELLRGQVDLASAKFAAADAVFQSLRQKAPGTRLAYRAQYWLGESLARQKKFEDAIKELNAVADAYASKSGKPVDAALAAEAWYALGWAQWHRQQFVEAAQAFSQALATSENVAIKRDSLLKLGEAFVRANKTADGVAKLREFLKAYPADLLADEVQFTVGELLMKSGEFRQAMTEFNQLAVAYPQSPRAAQATFNAGWCAWKDKQIAEATKLFQQAVALAKEPVLAADALFKLADAQFALEQYTEAIRSYSRLVAEHPGTAALDRALFQLGEAQRRAREAENATATFRKLTEQYRQSAFAAQAQFNLGQIAAATGQEPAARKAYETVIAHYAGSPWAREAVLAVGESYYRECKFAEAQTYFEKLIEGGLTTDLAQRAFYHRGWCLAQQKQTDKTLANFTEFLKQHPNSALAGDVQFWIADYYLQKKDYLKAQEQFQALATTYASNKLADSAQYYAGRAAYLRQDYKGAVELFQALLKSFPESSWRCDARFAQGDALTELGQYEDALVVFDNVLQQFPSCVLACEAAGRKADCLATLNRLDDAIASYRRAVDCAKDQSTRNQSLWKLGQCYERKQDLDSAAQTYSRALYETVAAPDPNEPPERVWACKAARDAASVKEQQQQWREAITLYDKLRDTCPDLKVFAEDRIRHLRTSKMILFP